MYFPFVSKSQSAKYTKESDKNQESDNIKESESVKLKESFRQSFVEKGSFTKSFLKSIHRLWGPEVVRKLRAFHRLGAEALKALSPMVFRSSGQVQTVQLA